MRVLCEAAIGVNDMDRRSVASKSLSHRIKQVIGVSVQVDVLDVGGVERSQGKAVRIVDNRPKES